MSKADPFHPPSNVPGTTAGLIRIVFMIDRVVSDAGGTENQLLKLIRGLSREKLEIHLVCLGKSDWLDRNIDNVGCPTQVIDVNRFKNPATYINILRLTRLLRRLDPDIVHTFFPVGNILGVLAARLAGVPRVISSRRDYGEWMSRRYLWATRLANRFVDAIVTNSQEVQLLTARMEGMPLDRIRVLWNGIDLKPFMDLERDEDLRRSLGIEPGKRVVGLVANLRPMKRHETFIAAAREILRQRQDVEFVLVGAEMKGRRAQLEALAKSFGVHTHFHFLGVRPDVSRLLSIMDVGVNCSQGEGLSNAVMEYMAAGVPCIVANSGGNPDLIARDVTGAMFELDDYDGLANGILGLLDDSRRAAELARNARRHVEAELSLPAMLAAYERLYEDLAGAHAHRASGPANIVRHQHSQSRS